MTEADAIAWHNDAELEAEARGVFRIVNAPSFLYDNGERLVWQVQRIHEGAWQTGYWCASEEAANKVLERCVARYVEWSKLTDEERMRRILRRES